MDLYDQIKELQQTNSTNDKQDILIRNKDSKELVWFLKNTYCPSIKFYIASKTYPKYKPVITPDLTITSKEVLELVKRLSEREVTGHAAIQELEEVQNRLDSNSAELLRYMILGDARIKVGAKSINKVWDKLIVDIPYNRCDLLSPKTINRINSEGVFTQLKGDGVFGVLVHNDGNVDLYTRNGTRYPREFAKMFSLGLTSGVVEGEVVWYDGDTPLERKVSNGITNSVANDGVIPTEYTPKLLVWNWLPYEDWVTEKSMLDYSFRLDELVKMVGAAKNKHVEVIESYVVYGGMEEVMKINHGFLKRGLEGSVVKFFGAKWAYNTNKEMIKIKVEVELDMIIESVEEASGKNAGMAGRVNVRSQDGRVVSGVNATGTDEERTALWHNRDSVVGKVCVVKCNDILSSEGRDTYALFLGNMHPKDIRFDKDSADDLQRIEKIFESQGVIKKLI